LNDFGIERDIDQSRARRIAKDRIRVAVEAPSGAYRPTTSLEDLVQARERLGIPAGGRWFVYVGGFQCTVLVSHLDVTRVAMLVLQMKPPG
jgi:predicted membrane metal-binding protein